MTAGKNEKVWIAQLLRRAGFGYSPAELKHYCELGFDSTLEELLNPQKIDNTKLEDAIKAQSFDFTNTRDLKRWWLYRMAFTQRPLEEKLTLFWHGHFATSERKVKNTYAMYLQNLLFRKYAFGNFQNMLMSVSMDPAMIVWLDNQQNRKGKPNENYAREIMELFTLGIGNYSESDIKEAARAFTGWQTKAQGFTFNQRQHDAGSKTVLGETGNLNGDDVVRILARHPATARHLARKLITFLAYDNPDKSFVEEVADAYLLSEQQIRPMLRAIFRHPTFRSKRAYHARIKSPAELVVGTIKTLQIEKLDLDLPQVMASMGQNLFEPPSVKGWDGGPAWISSDTMMERYNFAARIVSSRFNELSESTRPSQLVESQHLNNSTELVDYFLDLLVDGDVPASGRLRLIEYVSDYKRNTSGAGMDDRRGEKRKTVAGETAIMKDDRKLDAKLRGLVHLIMTLPAYQLT